jgi:hypothetical protein
MAARDIPVFSSNCPCRGENPLDRMDWPSRAPLVSLRGSGGSGCIFDGHPWTWELNYRLLRHD